MRIAIASSGLGHVARGVETWARDTAAALHERGVDVTLFAAAELADVSRTGCRVSALPCLRRFDGRTQRLAKRFPGFTWRWGLKSVYGWEQLSFWWHLWPKLRKGRYDIVHMQDPMLAFWCRKFRKLGLLHTKEILAHGTEEPIEFLKQFDYVQHLAPWHLDRALQAIEHGSNAEGPKSKGSKTKPLWTAIPNFVDTDVFRPRHEGERSVFRDRLEIPPDAFVIGTAATVKRPHKRIDYLIREFAAFAKTHQPSPITHHSYLLVAGSRTPESGELVRMASDLCGDQARVLLNVPREEMPDFYRSLDVFTLVSLFEMMPIAVLEALASGLPVVCSDIPNLAWMIGADDVQTSGNLTLGSAAIRVPGTFTCSAPGNAKQGAAHVSGPVENATGMSASYLGQGGGMLLDMSEEGGLTRFLAGVTPEWIAERGKAARQHAEQVFATDAVIGQYIEYYERVLRSFRRAR